MSEPNPDLLSVSGQINAAMRTIQRRKEATEDADEFRALNASLRELDQRLQRINGLIFAQRSQAIADAAQDVEQAQAELTDAIRDVEQLNQVLAAVTGFVGLVDTVIETASKASM